MQMTIVQLLVEQLLKIMKPVAKKIMLKIKEKTGKQFTDYELQQFFEFEERLPVSKVLKKQQKAEQAAQLEWELKRRQSKQKNKGS